MEKVNFMINNKVEIIWQDQQFSSNIQDFDEENIVIGIPILNGMYFPISRNEIIDVIYYVNDEAYKFTTKITGKKLENNIPQLILKYPTKIEKIQRREFVRIHISGDVRYKNYVKDFNNDFDKSGVMLDISGGGMRLLTHEDYPVGQKLEIEVILNEDKILVIGEVIRVLKNEVGYLCALKFDIIPGIQEKLIKDIFAIMRKKISL